jgi:hypothetical protein
MRVAFAILALILKLLVGTAMAGTAGPSFSAATEPLDPRPEIAAPPGGWWSEDGVYARVLGATNDSATVRRLADHAARAVPVLAKRLGVPAGGAMDIYIAPTKADFREMQPGEPPDWADGTAWPRQGLIFLHAPSARPGTAEPLEQVLDHEIVHILLGRAYAPRTPPRWLQEGVAQVVAGELGPETARTLGEGGDLFRLSEITRDFPGDPIRARMAYAASADFIGFLAKRYGDDAIRTLVAHMARGEAMDDALHAATGQSPSALEAAWRGSWADSLSWMHAESIVNVVWGLGGVALFVGAIRKRRQTKARLARMAREEEWEDRMRREAAWLHPVPSSLTPRVRAGSRGNDYH